MELFIEKRYLRLPEHPEHEQKAFLFSVNGEAVYGFNIKFAPDDPKYFYYADLRDYVGETLSLSFPGHDGGGFEPAFFETIPDRTDKRHDGRSPICYSPERGWINDPNGLVFDGESYHIFYQRNPYGNCWQNMTWGHAVTKDFRSYEELEDALLQDGSGAMFSGSGFIDRKNASGLGSLEAPPILLYYTAWHIATPAALCDRGDSDIRIAYSTDGGATFKKYEGNPIISGISLDCRDPKVTYISELDTYCMVLFSAEPDEFAFFTSEDLLDWHETQRFSFGCDRECPDLYPLICPDDGQKYWILSAANDHYYIGNFDSDGIYRPLESPKALCGEVYSEKRYNMLYAPQSFSGLEDGSRALRLYWNRSCASMGISRHSISFPMENMLFRVDGRLVLAASPAREFEGLHSELLSGELSISPKCCFTFDRARSFDLSVFFADPPDGVEISVMGKSFRIENGSLRGECTVLPLTGDSQPTLRIICDGYAVYIFADSGMYAVERLDERAEAGMSITADEEKSIKTELWTLHDVFS